ncbi:MAG: hypothetical protein AB7G93_06565 [Bdellovibrionales bacterium]
MKPESLSIHEILAFAPHRPPMVWVDEITHFQKDGGECLVHVRDDAHYMSPNGLRPSACVEIIAQAYGFSSICYTTRVLRPDAQPLKRALLVSFKNVRFARRELFAQVKANSSLRVPITGARQIGPITLFQGWVLHGPVELCQAQLKVYSE